MKNKSSDNSSNDYNKENLGRINILYTTGFFAALALSTIMQWINNGVYLRICKNTVRGRQAFYLTFWKEEQYPGSIGGVWNTHPHGSGRFVGFPQKCV